MSVSTYYLANILRDFEQKQQSLQADMMNSICDPDKQKVSLKELVAVNNILKLLIDYKQKYVDEQPVKEIKVKKDKSDNKEKKVSYGISNMMKK